MKLTQANIITILIISIAVLLCVIGYLIGGNRSQKTYLKEYMASKDSAVAQSHRRELQYMKEAAEFRQQAMELSKRDSIVYIPKLIANANKSKASDDRVDRIADSELERSITDWYNQ